MCSLKSPETHTYTHTHTHTPQPYLSGGRNSEPGSGRQIIPLSGDTLYLAEPGLAFGTLSFFNPPFISAANPARAILTSDLCSLD